MKTAVIKLEPFDDIVTVREKMDWSRSGRILLIYPDSFDVLDRKIDLMLLKRYSQEIGAQIAVASTDSEIQQNAREAGIPIFESVTVAQKQPWRRSRFRRIFHERQGINPELSERQASARPPKAGFWQSKKLRIAIFLTAVISIILLGLFFVPSARIYLPDIREKQTIVLPVWASLTVPAALPSGGLPASEVSVIVDSQGQTDSSGLAVVPDKAAAGYVTLTNLSSQAVKAPAGTIVLTLGSPAVRFEVLQDVTVPAGVGMESSAHVQAVQAGNKGNVSAGEILAIEGDLGLLLTVTNPLPTRGGDDRTASSPTEADYSTLRQRILEDLNQKALQEIQLKLTSDEKILLNSLKLVSVLEETQDPAVGQPSDQLKTTVRAEFSAWYIHLNDLSQVERMALDANLATEMAGIDGTLQSDNVNDPQIVNGTARWDVRVSRDVQRIWDREGVVSQILGKSKEEANQEISRMLGVSAPIRVETDPDWWPFLPALMFRIQVGVQ